MIYKLTVTRIENNPRYDAERARNFMLPSYTEPTTITTDVVVVALTAEEYAAVKRAVLTVMEPSVAEMALRLNRAVPTNLHRFDRP